MSSWFTAWLLGAVGPFLWAALQSSVSQWLHNKALAEAGALAQRKDQDAADAIAATKAKGVADEIHGLSDDEFARRAQRWP